MILLATLLQYPAHCTYMPTLTRTVSSRSSISYECTEGSESKSVV